MGAGDVQHGGVLPTGGCAAGGVVGHTGTQKLQLTLRLVLTDQMGQQRFHRAALHRRHRQVRRRDQQHAGALVCVFLFVGFQDGQRG